MPSPSRPRAFAVVGLLLLVSAGSARGAVEGPNRDKRLVAVRVTSRPVIDGRLDDDVWATIPADDRFTQQFPQDGAAPTERTEVRIGYDDEAIYVGIRLWDSEPDKIVARLTRRDRYVEADHVAVGFDSRHDHHTAFVFELNAAGVQTDRQLFDDTSGTIDWDAVWDGAVSRDDRGWSAEFKIPLQALRFSSSDVQEWGFNVKRHISRKQEIALWSYVPQGQSGWVSRWGHLSGLEGLKPRRTFELRPFAVARARTGTSSGGAFLGLDRGAASEGSYEVGLDVKLGLTSNLTLDATVNPDFGQVEADEVVLNLSRFETFFPEKRPFFLEGVDVFRTPIQVFYSRRIGRPPSGLTPGAGVHDDDGRVLEVTRAPAFLPIWAAVKLSGRVGDRLTVGVLDAVTGPEVIHGRDELGRLGDVTFAPVRHFAVGRVRWSAGGASYLGAIATAANRIDGTLRRPHLDHDAYVQSLDGQYVSPSGRWKMGGQALLSERVGGPSHVVPGGAACPDPAADPACVPITRADGTRIGPGDVGYGALAHLGYEGRHWGGGASYRVLSPTLDVNDLGFLQQFNEHRLEGGGGYRQLTPGRVFRNWNVEGGARLSMNFDRVFTGGGWGLDFNAVTRSFRVHHINVGTSFPGSWDPYETGDGAYVQKTFGMHAGTWFETDGRRRVSAGGGAGFWKSFQDDNAIVWTEANVALRLVPQMELSISPVFNLQSQVDRQWFFGGCVDDATGAPCTVNSFRRTYRFADLDSGSLSIFLRGAYTFSPRMSLQTYAQLFMSRGEFSERRTVSTAGYHPFIRLGDLRPDPTFTGDFDGDGKPDDAFQSTSLNLNVVLRWEFVPGSTLIGVYTRAQQGAYDLRGMSPRFRLTGLSSGPSEDVLLVKLVFFWA